MKECFAGWIKKFKMIITNISYSKLLKLEIPELTQRVINLVEDHDPEILKIKEIFDLLVAKQPEIEGLKVGYGRHPITRELQLARKKRLMYAASIVYKMGIIVRENANDMPREVDAAKIIIDQYLLHLSTAKNEEVVSQKLTQFSREMNENESFATAMSSFGLVSDTDSLKSVHSRVTRLTKERLQLLKKRPKAETAAKVKAIRDALTDFFMQVQVARLKHTDLDYNPLINEINGVIDHYRELVKTRATISKRKAVKKEQEEDAPIEPEMPTTETQKATMNHQPKMENDDVNENEASKEELEQKKAADKSSKTEQPPSDDDNDTEA